VVQTIGARIAKIAIREEGNHACAHGGYFSSCVSHEPHEEWCSDFARWVWSQAGVLYTDQLTPAAGSFGTYGRQHGTGLHKRPRVGDAVVFNDDGHGVASHVAIVVEVFRNGYISSIGGNERTYDYYTSYVHRDQYSGATGDSPYWSPYRISGYVTPMEDDMPYTKKQIRNLVKQGVRRELKNGRITQNEIKDLVKQGLNASDTETAKNIKKLLDRVPPVDHVPPPPLDHVPPPPLDHVPPPQ
jgi:surface antigen